MSEVLKFMKDIYRKIKDENLEWKNVYPNNMPCNGVDGIYTEMFFEKDGKYQYIKYTIEYCSRCDKDGISHPKEGVKYYVLHELKIDDLEEKFEIPEPTDKFDYNNDLACFVNEYGRFRYVFDDEETAKCVAKKDLKMMLYLYSHLLTEEEIDEWNNFVKEHDK